MSRARAAPFPEPDAATLLAWYDRHRRDLPWRARPGERADPYRVWLSEVMLQQTTVPAVIGYFARFLERWPDVRALAAAPLDDVLHAWQGLGYYARARNLHACARAVVERHGGVFPASEAALRELPGIGDYTAAAIAAIAFDLPATAVDGNVERVMARIYAIETPLPEAKPELRRLAAGLTPARRAGDYAQAAMDLGATLCTPRKPKCVLCPWRDTCHARACGIAEDLPRRRPAAEKPLRQGVAFWAVRADGAVLLRRRPETGLLGGMMEVPSTEWRGASWSDAEAKAEAPVRARWRRLPDPVRHTFTHFHLELTVLTGAVRAGVTDGGLWVPADRLQDYALPSLMKKVIAYASRGR
jgi:A/G-specific adenine glycosylase